VKTLRRPDTIPEPAGMQNSSRWIPEWAVYFKKEEFGNE